jgi:hypothetical protein
MIIKNAKYMGHESIGFIIQAEIDGEISIVPLDLANRHYAEIMRQVEAGELTIEEADSNV